MYEQQAILDSWDIIAVIYNGDSAKAPSRHISRNGHLYSSKPLSPVDDLKAF